MLLELYLQQPKQHLHSWFYNCFLIVTFLSAKTHRLIPSFAISALSDISSSVLLLMSALSPNIRHSSEDAQ